MQLSQQDRLEITLLKSLFFILISNKTDTFIEPQVHQLSLFREEGEIVSA